MSSKTHACRSCNLGQNTLNRQMIIQNLHQALHFKQPSFMYISLKDVMKLNNVKVPYLVIELNTDIKIQLTHAGTDPSQPS